MLLTALICVALGWMADRARTARRDAASGQRVYELAERITQAEAAAEDLARRLRECVEAAEDRGPTP